LNFQNSLLVGKLYWNDDLSDIISEVRALMYVVLSKEGNHVLYGELVGTTERITL